MTHQNVYEAINAVMQEIGYVTKQKGANLTYTYAGEAALIAAIRPHMVANEVVVFPSGVANRITREYLTKSGTAMVNVQADFSFTFWHGPSNTGFTVTVLGEGSDSGDKASAKAMTIAYKYALRQTFVIETGDDPDKYPSSDYERDPDEVYSPVKPAREATRRTTTAQDASQALPRTDANPQRPYAPKSLLKWFELQIKAATQEQRDSGITVETAKALAMAFKNTGLSDHERSDFGKALLGVDSFKDLSLAAANAMASWLKDVKSARQEVQDFLASLGTTEAD